MGASARRRRFDVDQVVATGSALGLMVVATLLLLDYSGVGAKRPPGAGIARLAAADGAVRWRSAGTLVWEAADAELPLAAGDAIFVQPGGAAAVAFRAGAVVELDERTLVVIEPPDPQVDRVRVVEGAVVAAAGSGQLAVGSGAGSAVIEPGGAVAVGSEGGLELLEGRAVVGGAAQGAVPRVPLLSPPRSQRIFSQDFPMAVALRWDGDAARALTLEVSRERSFATRVATGPGAAGFFEVSVDAPGPWYWRLAGAKGESVSEVRKFMAVVDRPPRPFSPAPGEIVLAPQGVQVPFWWTAVAGAARYRVEVASDPGFHRIALSEPAPGPGLWAVLDLPEGVYHWRVRAERSQEAERPSPPSPTVSFRLIRRPVLDAPELFDATLEEAGRAR